MEKYTNKYEVALAIAEKFGSTNDRLTNIFEALKEIATIKGLSGVYTTKYEILKALALNEGVVGSLSNSYECLLELAKIYGGSGFTNNYEAALYLLEHIDVDYPEWMKQVSTQTGIPVENLKQAEENYKFVDYLESTGTEWIKTNVFANNLQKWTLSIKFTATDEQTINGGFGKNNGSIDLGISNSKFFYRNGGRNICTIPVDTNKHKMILNRNGDSMLDNIVVPTIKSNVNSFNLYLFARSNENIATPFSYTKEQVFYSIYQCTDFTSYMIPCLKGNTPIMLDLMTMTEYTNRGTGTFAYGDIKSLESKFNEMGYGVAAMYDLSSEKVLNVQDGTFTIEDDLTTSELNNLNIE